MGGSALGGIFPSPLSLYSPEKTDPASQLQDWNVLGQYIVKNIPTLGSDAFANGAVGDGVHDDTAALQQTLNNTGVLYLRPNKNFLISQPIVLPQTFGTVLIYGGGFITATAAITMISSVGGTFNIRIEDVALIGTGAGTTCISIQNNGGQWNTITSCYISAAGGIAVVLSNLATNWTLARNYFQGNIGVSLGATIANVEISDNDFSAATTPITTTGSPITYNARGNSTYIDYYGVPQMPRALVYQSALQTIANATITVLNFGTAAYNIGTPAIWASGNPSRFTAPVAGNYDVLFGFLYASAGGAAGSYQTALKLNGALTSAPEYIVATGVPAAFTYGTQIAGSFDLNANDFVEVETTQSSGGALNTTPAATFGMMVLRSRP